ncbi:hypothetical protein HanIR_Chr08g0347741 [Helianthus annuus]|nr:hypothetical protein HanIR_Chr08g0347741 [Helianthus annuus]
MTTVILEVITSVTDKPTNAHAYCVDRFPRLKTTPPAIANRMLGQLFCNKKKCSLMHFVERVVCKKFT